MRRRARLPTLLAAPSPTMSQVELLHDWSAVARLRDDWRRLHAVTPCATFFHSFDWLETYWKFYGAGQALRTFVVRDAGDVTGIVPLVVLEESTKLGPLKILTYPLAYWGSYYGPIGPRLREALAAALDRLAHERRDWDLLDLRFTPPATSDEAHTLDVMTTAGFAPAPKVVDHTSFIDLPGTFDDYLATRPVKWRTNYRRWLRRLHERGTVRDRALLPDGNDRRRSASVRRRSAVGFVRRLRSDRPQKLARFLDDRHDADARFDSSVSARDARNGVPRGAADVHLLYLNEQPLAFLYAYRNQRTMYGLRIGFDASISRDGVGNIMYMHALEDSIRRDIRTFDLGPGSLKAKEPIRSRIEPIYRLPYANAYTWRGFAWRMKQTISTVEAALADFNADYRSPATSEAAAEREPSPISSST
ncbi:MAG: GNAT family N-acetyltransferase [Pirellulales bacterium]